MPDHTTGKKRRKGAEDSEARFEAMAEKNEASQKKQEEDVDSSLALLERLNQQNQTPHVVRQRTRRERTPKKKRHLSRSRSISAASVTSSSHRGKKGRTKKRKGRSRSRDRAGGAGGGGGGGGGGMSFEEALRRRMQQRDSEMETSRMPVASKPAMPNVKICGLPKLPKEAAKRLELLRRSGRQTLEREMYEVYTDMLKRNEDIGMSEMDLQGPTSFHTKMDIIRPQVEQQYHTANKRLAIAKRIAGSSKQPDELLKSKELLKSELEAVEEAQYAARAYTLMVQLFAKVIDRVSNAVAEREAQKSIRPEFVSSIGCQSEEATTLPRPPKLGIYAPLDRDAVMPLDMTPEEMESIQHTELAYNVMRDLCQKDRLCIYQVLQFEDWMKEEKTSLQKCLPSRERILRMAAYNRIVRSFRSSHFNEELQAHKIWRITNLAEYYDPPGSGQVPDYEGQFSMFALPVGSEARESEQPDALERHDRDGDDSQKPDQQSAAMGAGHHSGTAILAEADVLDQEAAAQDREASEGVGLLEGICVVCIEKSALFVMHECGHLIFCPGCRRKAVAKALKESGKSQWKSVKPGQLSNKELERTKVRCPICREESVAVAQKKFSGKVYT
eukprot:s5169_g3.t1